MKELQIQWKFKYIKSITHYYNGINEIKKLITTANWHVLLDNVACIIIDKKLPIIDG